MCALLPIWCTATVVVFTVLYVLYIRLFECALVAYSHGMVLSNVALNVFKVRFSSHYCIFHCYMMKVRYGILHLHNVLCTKVDPQLCCEVYFVLILSVKV